MSRTRLISIIATGAVVCVVAAGTPASAAVPAKVFVTAGYNGTGTFTTGTKVVVTAASTGPLAIVDNRSGISFNCGRSSLKSDILLTGPNKSPSVFALISSPNGTFSGCTLAGGGMTITQVRTWAVRTDQTSTPLPATATTPPISGQTTQVALLAIGLSITTGGCTFTAGGKMVGTFTNGNPSTLTLANSNGSDSTDLSIGTTSPSGTGCVLGKLQAGDKMSLIASTTYNVTGASPSNGAALNPFWVAAF